MSKVSFIIPCYASEHTISSVVQEINETMEKLKKYQWEIILVNDASPDKTFSVIKKLCKENDNITGLDMARNFGQHAAIMAGFHCMSGDIAVCLDDDGQTPADEVGKLLEKIEKGYDAVYATYGEKKHSVLRNLGSKINKRMTESLLGKPKKLYVSSYFAAKRFVVEEVKKYQYKYPYVLGLVLRTTKNICNVTVQHRERQVGQSGYSMRKLLALWVNGFTAFSVKPLRVATISGVLAAVVGGVYAIWTIIKKFTNPAVPVGWSSTIAIMLILGGMILFVLGMLGEYIGRIYICINNSPQYVVRERIGMEQDMKE